MSTHNIDFYEEISKIISFIAIIYLDIKQKTHQKATTKTNKQVNAKGNGFP